MRACRGGARAPRALTKQAEFDFRILLATIELQETKLRNALETAEKRFDAPNNCNH